MDPFIFCTKSISYIRVITFIQQGTLRSFRIENMEILLLIFSQLHRISLYGYARMYLTCPLMILFIILANFTQSTLVPCPKACMCVYLQDTFPEGSCRVIKRGVCNHGVVARSPSARTGFSVQSLWSLSCSSQEASVHRSMTYIAKMGKLRTREGEG